MIATNEELDAMVKTVRNAYREQVTVSMAARIDREPDPDRREALLVSARAFLGVFDEAAEQIFAAYLASLEQSRRLMVVLDGIGRLTGAAPSASVN